jgi:hypothetical protein
MISKRTKSFNKKFSQLPEEVKLLAIKTYKLWKNNHQHPSLQYKKMNEIVRSVRIGDGYSALGEIRDDSIIWFWIGTHEEYNNLI